MSTALFGGLSSGPNLSELKISDIRPDPDQPRKAFDQTALEELAQSIKEHGVLQPILVRKDPETHGKYLLISGERRFRASQLAEQETIPAILRTAENAMVIAIIENMQRVDLSPVEEATAVARLIEDQGISQGDAAKLLGRNRLSINQLLKIHTLPVHIQEGAQASEVSKSILVELALLEDEDTQLRLWKRAKDGNLTVAEIRKAKKGTTNQDAKDKSEGVRRLTPTQKALKTVKRGVAALQGKPLSEDDRTEIRDLIAKLNATTAIADTPLPEDKA